MDSENTGNHDKSSIECQKSIRETKLNIQKYISELNNSILRKHRIVLQCYDDEMEQYLTIGLFVPKTYSQLASALTIIIDGTC